MWQPCSIRNWLRTWCRPQVCAKMNWHRLVPIETPWLFYIWSSKKTDYKRSHSVSTETSGPPAVLWISTRPLANATKFCCGRIDVQNPFAHVASDFYPRKDHVYSTFVFEKILYQPRLILVSKLFKDTQCNSLLIVYPVPKLR